MRGLKGILLIKIVVGVGVLFNSPLAYSMNQSYQQGQSFVQSIPLPQPQNPSQVPGYAGTDLPQSKIKAHDLGEAALRASQENEGSQIISENLEKGERFVIDPHTDPLIVEANRVVADPQKTLNEEFTDFQEPENAGKEIKTCEESGEETIESGDETRVVTVEEPVHLLQVYVYSHGWSGGLSRNVITGAKLDGSTSNTGAYAAGTTIYNPLTADLQKRFKSIEFAPEFSCPNHVSLSASGVLSVRTGSGGSWFFVNGLLVSINVLLKPGEENVSENIVSTCHALEERVDRGLCSYDSEVVVEGPETRVISEYPVTRDWWRRKRFYRCHHPSLNNCGDLRNRGCYQIKSACKEKVDNACVVWEQTYECPSTKISGKSYRSSNKETPFCLSGDCADKSYEPNQDFAQVMSHMSVLKEAGDDFKNFGAIFKGVARKCTRHCVGFKDCCGNGKGWGVSLSLASCDADEKELAVLREKNRCVMVGTYCAEKTLGVCIRKKTSFCCYGTKLAKIVQEQGKGQLGLGFGSPENPACQGLTPEQLSKLDFSRINFSELFSEIVGRTKTPNPEKILSGIQKSMETKASLLKPSVKGVNAESLTTPSTTPYLKSPQPGNESLPGNTSESTPKTDNLPIQGRSHGQF